VLADPSAGMAAGSAAAPTVYGWDLVRLRRGSRVANASWPRWPTPEGIGGAERMTGTMPRSLTLCGSRRRAAQNRSVGFWNGLREKTARIRPANPFYTPVRPGIRFSIKAISPASSVRFGRGSSAAQAQGRRVAGKTPNYEIRGSYSRRPRGSLAGGAYKRSVALQQLKRIEECIETHGCYPGARC